MMDLTTSWRAEARIFEAGHRANMLDLMKKSDEMACQNSQRTSCNSGGNDRGNYLVPPSSNNHRQRSNSLNVRATHKPGTRLETRSDKDACQRSVRSLLEKSLSQKNLYLNADDDGGGGDVNRRRSPSTDSIPPPPQSVSGGRYDRLAAIRQRSISQQRFSDADMELIVPEETAARRLADKKHKDDDGGGRCVVQ